MQAIRIPTSLDLVGAINLLDYSPSGTDYTSALQSAVSDASSLGGGGGTIIIPKNINISDTVTLGRNVKIVGLSRGGSSIHQLDNSKFVFQYTETDSLHPYCGIVIDGLSIVANNGIQIGLSSGSVSCIGPVIRNVNMSGGYDVAVDSNRHTGVVPTQEELDGYGAGVKFWRVFDSIIENCSITWYGVGVYYTGNINLGSDVNEAFGNRIAYCARWVQCDFGGRNLLRHNDLLDNQRVGGVFLGGASHNFRIHSNYFETAADSATYIISENDTNAQVMENMFELTDRLTPNFVSLNSMYGLVWRNNKYNISGTSIQIPEVLTSNWHNHHPVLAEWDQNDTGNFDNVSTIITPPDVPGVRTNTYDPYTLSYKNFAYLGGAASSDGIPFVASPVTGRYAIKTNLTPITWSVTPVDRAHRIFLIKLTARKISGSGVFVAYYNEGGITNVITDYNVPISSTTETEVVSYIIIVPSDKLNVGNWGFEISTNILEVESLILYPITYNSGIATISRNGVDTSVDWPHGLPNIPNVVQTVPQESDGKDFFVPQINIGSSTFRLEIPVAVSKIIGAVDVAFLYYETVYADFTAAANNATVNDVWVMDNPALLNDAFYIGLSEPFGGMDIKYSTAGVGTWTVIWEYYNGFSWATLQDVSDGTSGYTAMADTYSVTFTIPTDWGKVSVNSISKYWVRSRVSVAGSTTTQPKIDQVWVQTAMHFLWRAE